MSMTLQLPAKDSNLDQQGQNLPSCH